MQTSKQLKIFIFSILIFVVQNLKCQNISDIDLSMQGKLSLDSVYIKITLKNRSSGVNYFIPISEWFINCDLFNKIDADNYLYTPTVMIYPSVSNTPSEVFFSNSMYSKFWPKFIYLNDTTINLEIKFSDSLFCKDFKNYYQKYKKWKIALWLPITPDNIIYKINSFRETANDLDSGIIDIYDGDEITLQNSQNNEKISLYNNKFSKHEATKADCELLMIAFMNHIKASCDLEIVP